MFEYGRYRSQNSEVRQRHEKLFEIVTGYHMKSDIEKISEAAETCLQLGTLMAFTH